MLVFVLVSPVSASRKAWIHNDILARCGSAPGTNKHLITRRNFSSPFLCTTCDLAVATLLQPPALIRLDRWVNRLAFSPTIHPEVAVSCGPVRRPRFTRAPSADARGHCSSPVDERNLRAARSVQEEGYPPGYVDRPPPGWAPFLAWRLITKCATFSRGNKCQSRSIMLPKAWWNWNEWPTCCC